MRTDYSVHDLTNVLFSCSSENSNLDRQFKIGWPLFDLIMTAGRLSAKEIDELPELFRLWHEDDVDLWGMHGPSKPLQVGDLDALTSFLRSASTVDPNVIAIESDWWEAFSEEFHACVTDLVSFLVAAKDHGDTVFVLED
jgi:hypothetical protein